MLKTKFLILYFATLLLAQELTPKPPLFSNSFDKSRLENHVKYLASDKLEGRNAGHRGNRKAVRYIVREFKRYGLKPAGKKGKYLQKFKLFMWKCANVIGLYEGYDEKLKHQIIVVGAHIDHLGMEGQIGPGRLGKSTDTDKIWNGADDNASGTAVLLEVARVFTKLKVKTKRSILFIGFNAEEYGFVGSKYYTKHPSFPLENHIAMINLDMLGRNPDKSILIRGTGTSKVWKEIIKSANQGVGLKFEFIEQAIPVSDHYPFASSGIPAIQIHARRHKDYHRISDHPEKLDYNRMLSIAIFVSRLIYKLANLQEKPVFVNLKLKKATELIKPANIKEHIQFLASDKLEGRFAGSKGNQKAAKYIANYFGKLKLKPAGKPEKKGIEKYFQEFFSLRDVKLQNVVAVYEGRDKKLKKEVILIGAHFDHIGKKIKAKEGEDNIYNGADDNASGVSALMEIAGAFAKSRIKTKRSIIFVAFNAEELGSLGARFYIKRPHYPLKNHIAMINLDMLGRNPQQPVIIEWTNTSKIWKKIIKECNQHENLKIRFERDVPGSADSHIFVKAKIPSLDFFTNYHQDYHEVTDEIEKIDFQRVTKISRLVFRIAYKLACIDTPPKWKDPDKPTHIARMGIDILETGMLQRQVLKFNEGEGAVKIVKIEKNSPAHFSGLKKKDLIICVNSARLPDKEPVKWFVKKTSNWSVKKLTLSVLRGKKKLKIKIRLRGKAY